MKKEVNLYLIMLMSLLMVLGQSANSMAQTSEFEKHTEEWKTKLNGSSTGWEKRLFKHEGKTIKGVQFDISDFWKEIDVVGEGSAERVLKPCRAAVYFGIKKISGSFVSYLKIYSQEVPKGAPNLCNCTGDNPLDIAEEKPYVIDLIEGEVITGEVCIDDVWNNMNPPHNVCPELARSWVEQWADKVTNTNLTKEDFQDGEGNVLFGFAVDRREMNSVIGKDSCEVVNDLPENIIIDVVFNYHRKGNADPHRLCQSDSDREVKANFGVLFGRVKDPNQPKRNGADKRTLITEEDFSAPCPHTCLYLNRQ